MAFGAGPYNGKGVRNRFACIGHLPTLNGYGAAASGHVERLANRGEDRQQFLPRKHGQRLIQLASRDGKDIVQCYCTGSGQAVGLLQNHFGATLRMVRVSGATVRLFIRPTTTSRVIITTGRCPNG